MKKILYTSLLLLTELSVIGQTKNVQYEAYIKDYSPIAIEKMQEYGIPASITLAQGILESGAGQSRLAKEANNHFGIKCHKDWTGETIHHDDDALQECFRKYTQAKQSYDDHSLFLTTRDRYAFLFKLDKTDYASWAKGLKEAGYATDPKYPERLIKIIEDYELYRFDGLDTKSKNTYLTEKKQENIPPKQKHKKRENIAVDHKQEVTQENTETDSKTKIFYSDKIIGQITAYSTHEVKEINGVKYVVASENDSYENIAHEFGLKTREIYAINDVPKNTTLEAGEIVFIRKKKTSSSNVTFHVVKPDETMREIAQKYGIRLKTLYKKNNIKEGVRPMIGQRLNLK